MSDFAPNEVEQARIANLQREESKYDSGYWWAQAPNADVQPVFLTGNGWIHAIDHGPWRVEDGWRLVEKIPYPTNETTTAPPARSGAGLPAEDFETGFP